MSILINRNTKVIVQGITGKEGQKATRAMLDYHTNVFGGVRPGKGGEVVEGVLVFNSVKEAVDSNGGVEDVVAAIFVPPFAAKEAMLEAINNNIPLISVIVERIRSDLFLRVLVESGWWVGHWLKKFFNRVILG